MKVLTIVGARPQFVKAAVLSREFIENSHIEEVIVHTGQHFDKGMSDVFFEEMEIPHPKYNLNIHSLQHGAMTGRMLEGIEELILKETPDILLVYGDTNSTIAGALAARKLQVKVAHVEAGLRSFNMQMPEEINRILTDRISDILFCPTDTAIKNLQKEGFDHFNTKVVRSGDVMQDAAMHYAKFSEKKSNILGQVNKKRFILATIHRAENTDDPVKLKSIVESLNAIHENVPVVFPIHPRTRNVISTSGLQLKVNLIDPVGYFDMIELLKNCDVVMTDSGGVQKEAFFFAKPCVTLREQTEWVELVDHGFNWLTGTDTAKINEAVKNALTTKLDFSIDLYGGGNAASIICKELTEFIQK